MLTDFLAKYKRPIIIGGGILVVLIVGWVIYYNVFFFHITSISPNPDKVSYLSPRLVVDFNKELVNNTVQVSSKDITVNSTVQGKQLIINLPDNLKGDQTYTITVDSISSKNGDTIKNHSILLKTVLNSDSLTDADKKIILDKQQAAKSPIINDPIFSYLPYSTLDYSIDGALTNGDNIDKAITLTITITLSAADAKIDSAAATEQYHQEALSYLNSLKGVDINKYNVFVDVINPTL